MQAWLLILVGVLSGPLFDIGYFRPMLYLGNFLVVLGIMTLSLCTQYWQVFLTQGVCMGLGAGLLYVPSLALIGIWFERRRAMAMGIVMSGIAVGGVIYIIIFDRLTQRIGFAWAVRVIGFVALFAALLSFPALLSGSSILARPRQARRLFDKTALRDRLFLLFTATTFITFLGYIVPYFYIPTYAREKLGSSESTGLYMLVIAVAGSFFGRLGSGLMAHHLGAIFTWMMCNLASGILALCWMLIKTERALIAFSALWGELATFNLDFRFETDRTMPFPNILPGFFSAALVTLPSAAFANISPDLSLLGTRLGMSWGVSSIATLIGAPIAGALLKTKNGETDFSGVSIWSGVCLLVGTSCCCVLWFSAVRRLGKGWLV